MALVAVTPADNAQHRSIFPEYIEWWYVDALLSRGYHLAGSLAVWGNLQRPNSCVVRSDFALTASNGTVVDFGERVPLASFCASDRRCDVRLNQNYLQDAVQGYLLHLQRDDGVSLDLTITPECPGFGYEHRFTANGSRLFSWIVPAPRARVKGKLRNGREQISFVGIGYHDHNWASVSLSQELSAWQWGCFHGVDDTLLFAVVEGNGQILYRGLTWIKRAEKGFAYQCLRVASPGPNVRIEIRPWGWNLVVTDHDIRVLMRVEREKLLLQRELAGHYQRFMSRVRGTITAGQRTHEVSGTMVHEFKILR